ncbi:MAG TPA: hypothetical protein VGF38_20470, partial [Ktedonobacterales bacterium]
MVLVFSDAFSWMHTHAVDGQRVKHATPQKRHKKTLSSRLGRKGSMPSVVPPTFHAANAITHSSRASLLADNGC